MRHPIRLLNPIASQLSVMRSSLLGGLVANVRYNLNRRASRVRVFEIGRVFLRTPGRARGAARTWPASVSRCESAAAAFGSAAEEQWGVARREVDFFDVKGRSRSICSAPSRARFEPAAHPALHPGRSARIVLGTACGRVAR